ncbi:TadE/TadG family type IV pilus assembly protein [Sphingomonas sp.]|uniref:TadE/TadG family type IV pilus assembly protein n=1 Tax=Sphingomonas sp. TaxID=28214 RepID=UPI002DBB8127|nr:TadE/TadG family type IV pilus assembly protein [Sphingomonas sp.]HEU4969583.1 TadE/TadG family type IV pilus assembly protein [Sphingomonas sp.]
MIRPLAALARDRRGTTLVEFAVLAPTLLVLIMASMELAHQSYAQSVLEGALQKAARDSSLEGGAQRTDAIDDAVKTQIARVIHGGIYTSSRKSYSNFSNLKGERFTDNNSNGKRDSGECFDDANGNKTWDADPGISGQGGANDVTMYRMQVSYPRLFPLAGLLGWPDTRTISATTYLKNQPFGTQSAVVTICT